MRSRLVTLVLGLVGMMMVLGLSEQTREGQSRGLSEQTGPKLRGLRVAIGPDVAKERCREVVANIKVGEIIVSLTFLSYMK